MFDFFRKIGFNDDDEMKEETITDDEYSADEEMLKDLFYRNVSVESEWLFVWSGDGRYQEIKKNKDKQLALKVVTRGKYDETSIIHLKIEYDFSCGIAFTNESVCVGGSKGRYNIKYEDISDAENTPYGLIITKRNGEEIKLESEDGETIVFLGRYAIFLNLAKNFNY